MTSQQYWGCTFHLRVQGDREQALAVRQQIQDFIENTLDVGSELKVFVGSGKLEPVGPQWGTP